MTIDERTFFFLHKFNITASHGENGTVLQV